MYKFPTRKHSQLGSRRMNMRRLRTSPCRMDSMQSNYAFSIPTNNRFGRWPRVQLLWHFLCYNNSCGSADTFLRALVPTRKCIQSSEYTIGNPCCSHYSNTLHPLPLSAPGAAPAMNMPVHS